MQPKSHEFVSVEDTKHDRVVIAQILNESDASSAAGSIKVVGVKTVLSSLGGRWKLCFVHGTAAEGISLDLFGFVCLDVVPYNWHQEPSDERYPLVRAQLMESMKNTRDVAPDSISNLRKFLWQRSIPTQYARTCQALRAAMPPNQNVPLAVRLGLSSTDTALGFYQSGLVFFRPEADTKTAVA